MRAINEFNAKDTEQTIRNILCANCKWLKGCLYFGFAVDPYATKCKNYEKEDNDNGKD